VIHNKLVRLDNINLFQKENAGEVPQNPWPGIHMALEFRGEFLGYLLKADNYTAKTQR